MQTIVRGRQAPAHSHRVLVVDDHLDGAEIAGLCIECDGHLVFVCHSGDEALAAAVVFAPDVAVLDINMPGMDGHELAAALWKLPDMWGCRMIALTANDDAATRRKSMAAGFSHHLVKPASRSTLLAAVCNDHEVLPNVPPQAAA